MEFALLLKILWLALSGIFAYGGIVLLKHGGDKIATGELAKKRDIKDLLGTDGIQISKNYTLSEKQCNGQTVVIAPTRTGKTTSIFIPNLLQNNLRGSIIVPDPKGELFNLTSKYQKTIGRKVIQYKPLEDKIHINLLSNCRNEREVKALGQSLLINGALAYELQTGKQSQGIEWIQMATSLLNASLLHFYPKGTIQNALNLILTHTDDELDQTFASSNKHAQMQYLAFKTCVGSAATMASIKNTLSSNMQLFTDNLAIDRNDIDFTKLRKEETIIYITYPENKAIYLSPLMACFYSQLIDHLIDDYTKDSLPIWVLADEFCNLGQWSNFAINMATAGSRRINFVLCLQSTSQLTQIYGNNSKSILNNCNNKIVLPGESDIDTLRWISELCGEEEIQYMKNKEEVKTKKKLFDMSEVRRILTGYELIILSNRQPIVDEQNIYYKQEKYLSKL